MSTESRDVLSPELRALVDEAGPGAYVARAADVRSSDWASEWCLVDGGNNWRPFPCSANDYVAVIVRPRRVTVEVDVDLLEAVFARDGGFLIDSDADRAVNAIRRLIDEANATDQAGGS